MNCPVCGKDNNCGVEQGKTRCWCETAPMSLRAALAKMPVAEAKVCVCAGCAERLVREMESC